MTDEIPKDDLTLAYLSGYHNRDDEVIYLKKRLASAEKVIEASRNIIKSHVIDGRPGITSLKIYDQLKEGKK